MCNVKPLSGETTDADAALGTKEASNAQPSPMSTAATRA